MTIDNWISSQLEAKKRVFKDGNLGALLDVLKICREHEQPLPDWAFEELAGAYLAFITGQIPAKSGRHAKWAQQYKEDMKALRRYEEVLTAAEYGIPWSRDRVYRAASMMLEGTTAAGRPGTIKSAYERVKKRSKEDPGRYHVLSYGWRLDDAPKSQSPERRNQIMRKLHDWSKTPEMFGPIPEDKPTKDDKQD